MFGKISSRLKERVVGSEMTSTHYRDAIIMKCSSDESPKIAEYFEEDDSRLEFVGEVRHGKREWPVYNTKMKMSSLSGNLRIPRELDFIPWTFYRVTADRSLIAKAVVQYFNLEETDCAPTIELIEVVKGRTGKGIGRRVLEEIEEDMLDRRFDRMWATDMKSAGFWERMGYEFDLEEGFKYLG